MITKIESDNLADGFKYFKSTWEYKNEEAVKEGDVACYYPSDKLFYQTKDNSTFFYFHEGEMSGVTVTDANGQTISEVIYDKEGKVISQKGK